MLPLKDVILYNMPKYHLSSIVILFQHEIIQIEKSRPISIHILRPGKIRCRIPRLDAPFQSVFARRNHHNELFPILRRERRLEDVNTIHREREAIKRIGDERQVIEFDVHPFLGVNLEGEIGTLAPFVGEVSALEGVMSVQALGGGDPPIGFVGGRSAVNPRKGVHSRLEVFVGVTDDAVGVRSRESGGRIGVGIAAVCLAAGLDGVEEVGGGFSFHPGFVRITVITMRFVAEKIGEPVLLLGFG
mmetsp:Transcript_26496/g.55615  ORF Transcript_26496/g.55615 Transcript_26496/m.55615 type:complete len:245 (-) Transcript_26496:1974-2708(-)